jgi:hypothetical protein
VARLPIRAFAKYFPVETDELRKEELGQTAKDSRLETFGVILSTILPLRSQIKMAVTETGRVNFTFPGNEVATIWDCMYPVALLRGDLIDAGAGH